MEREEEHAAAPAEIEPLSTSKKKNKDKNKRRFSDEQIRLLETIFESETKLEPKKKMQLARELCLQPRQVAIWFQNRRARWKSRQIEQEYRALKANYDKLASQFESLKEENQSLILQLAKLSELVGKSHDGNGSIKDSERHSTDGSSDNWGTNCETEAKACFLPKGLDLDHRRVMFEDNDQSKNIEYSADGAQELLNMGEYVDYSSVSPEKWCSFESGGLFDQSCNSANWMNFWTCEVQNHHRF